MKELEIVKIDYINELKKYINDIKENYENEKLKLKNENWKSWEITPFLEKKYGKEFIAISKKENDEIDRIINEIAESKINNLIENVKKIGGSIINCEVFEGFKVSFNGYVNCENGVIKVNTIIAGGYNIQPLHFRTLIKKLK